MAVGLKHEERVDKIVRKVRKVFNPLWLHCFSAVMLDVRYFLLQFMGYNFVVMLFHYDGNVDDWSDFKWSTRVLHVVAAHQTKWYVHEIDSTTSFLEKHCFPHNIFFRWFAKRFLHPDIVSQYSYIFLWDEDLGVENFNVQR